jgi:hypothetical protein
VDDDFFARRIVAIEERGEALVRRRLLAGAIAAAEERVFLRRTRFEDADEMLERPLSGGLIADCKLPLLLRPGGHCTSGIILT